MKTLPPLLRWSLFLFAFAFLVFILTGVVLDSALASVPQAIQRAMIVLLIVVPNTAGAVLAFLALFRKPRKILLTVLALVLNTMSALFYTFLVFMAG